MVQETSAEVIEFKSRLSYVPSPACRAAQSLVESRVNKVSLMNCKRAKAVGIELKHCLQSLERNGSILGGGTAPLVLLSRDSVQEHLEREKVV